ncbi:MAG: pyridoxal-phosphate dependent enzyme, partial [Bacteroidia bacterium]|nr:pyridoxal-phosphate dependent enzyme [Bacteroidia bacterium]
EYGGNKCRKLKYNIEYFKSSSHNCIITFGGPFSNNIASLASISKVHGIHCIGIIRGEFMDPENPTLKKARQEGMIIHHVPKTEYRLKEESGVIQEIIRQFDNPYIIPEGGANSLGSKGVEEIMTELHKQIPDVQYIVVPAGTGTTATGIIEKAAPGQKIYIINVLKHQGMSDLIASRITNTRTDWQVIHDYHMGGFAKVKPQLVNFINHFRRRYKISLDPIYTGKMMYAVDDMMRKSYFSSGANIVAIHTGGLQGITAYNYRQKQEKMLIA